MKFLPKLLFTAALLSPPVFAQETPKTLDARLADALERAGQKHVTLAAETASYGTVHINYGLRLDDQRFLSFRSVNSSGGENFFVGDYDGDGKIDFANEAPPYVSQTASGQQLFELVGREIATVPWKPVKEQQEVVLNP